jgi:hypothetical protein
MSFALISTLLGVCFALVWAYVGMTILRLGQLAARQEKDAPMDPQTDPILRGGKVRIDKAAA